MLIPKLDRDGVIREFAILCESVPRVVLLRPVVILATAKKWAKDETKNANSHDGE